MTVKLWSFMLLCVLIVGLAVPEPVYAYLDPGTGSYVFQLVIGVIVAALFMLRGYWGKVREFAIHLLHRSHGSRKKDDDGAI